jgi:hypothetical protein
MPACNFAIRCGASRGLDDRTYPYRETIKPWQRIIKSESRQNWVEPSAVINFSYHSSLNNHHVPKRYDANMPMAHLRHLSVFQLISAGRSPSRRLAGYGVSLGQAT